MGPDGRSNLAQPAHDCNRQQAIVSARSDHAWGFSGLVEREFALWNLPLYRRFHYMDKREAVRVPVQVRARCRAHGIVIDGLVEDVSRSGLFMRSPRQIQPGSSVELDLDLPGEV